jgi:hypothetical protein
LPAKIQGIQAHKSGRVGRPGSPWWRNRSPLMPRPLVGSARSWRHDSIMLSVLCARPRCAFLVKSEKYMRIIGFSSEQRVLAGRPFGRLPPGITVLYMKMPSQS